jgi:hypothetical protein
MNKSFGLSGLMVFLSALPLYACFDTYLFLQKSSMVYPEKQFVVEASGEYVMPDFSASQSGEDILSGNFNAYYGITKRFSIQAGLSSSEKERSSFAIDGYGIRAVYGIFQNYNNLYNLDVILEHAAPFEMTEASFEISAPSIFHVNNFTYVIHPVLSFGKNVEFGLRGHGGAFYRINNLAVVGIGAEYASAQSGSQFGKRMVDGEAATSLFFGTQIGVAYLQNEFIKGWGANGNDFGFAATLKFVLPSFKK